MIYVDEQGQEIEQPADLVILCAFAYNNVHLMLLSGIGKPYDPQSGQGVVGRNYAYQVVSSVDAFFDDKFTNTFVGAGALGTGIDEFNGDNFDHSGLGFIGGGYIACWTTNGRPIETHPTPEGTPRWGAKWKKAVADNYLKQTAVSTHGAVMSYQAATTSIWIRPIATPTAIHCCGLPITFTDNDRKLSDYLTDRAAEIARAMKPREIKINRRQGDYTIVPYQTTHNTGGAVMGNDRNTSAVNRYLQSWDVSNVFVMGSSVFPQNPGYNPTGTVGALTYWAADAIRNRYLKNPGPLVQA